MTAMSTDSKRPECIVIRMRIRDWKALDRLQQLTGLVSKSETVRAAVRAELQRLERAWSGNETA